MSVRVRPRAPFVFYSQVLFFNLSRKKIVFIDELDSSISTLALIHIFNNLINTEENHNGQLIVSSHNVLLFDVSFLNSQQIFLIQKDQHLESKIRTYYDYDIRSEKKKAYIDYLKGLYDE
ncbi:AAA family ATPase [Campylobacter insulaenigrae]|uniref:AAA family ATPase n=1 Tax=Campylobacter insulaenigrae TaxID=260714 RepID=UPI002152DE2C|nr:AAA family ATPase [Campylobacter insulaenigrae]MCR6571289.1 AAA family ATPase [Campylobacter insulaenigrae]